MLEVPNFWEWMARKYHALDAYKTFMHMKQDLNKKHCFKCNEDTCCVFTDLRGNTNFTDLLGIKFLSIPVSRTSVTKPLYSNPQPLCAGLTTDFRCSVEEIKPSKCLFHRCRELSFGDREYDRWFRLIRILREHHHLHRQMREEKIVGRLSFQYSGFHYEDWLHTYRLEWVELHPEYPDIVRERLHL